jgi:methionyl-tRNA synthetase
MGKDNVYFHAIYFPSVQIGDGSDWTTLHHLSTTGQHGVWPFIELTDGLCLKNI